MISIRGWIGISVLAWGRVGYWRIAGLLDRNYQEFAGIPNPGVYVLRM